MWERKKGTRSTRQDSNLGCPKCNSTRVVLIVFCIDNSQRYRLLLIPMTIIIIICQKKTRARRYCLVKQCGEPLLGCFRNVRGAAGINRH